MDGGKILGVGALLDHVALDQAHPAIRQVDAVTRAAGIVLDPAARNAGGQGPAFDLMAHDRIMEIAVLDGEGLDGADIQIMGEAGA